MELSNVIKSLEDVIAELKEVEYKRLNDVITLHLQKNNSELISRCILKQPENSSKAKTWKEFCEEENKRRIEDLEKENKRLKEEIQKSNNDWCSFVVALFTCYLSVMNRGDENEPLT